MSKKAKYSVNPKKDKKASKVIEGGYVSSLCGISQSERATDYKLSRRGAGVFENKKRKHSIKPKHKKSSNYLDSCASYFFYLFSFKKGSINNLKPSLASSMFLKLPKSNIGIS